MLVCMILVMPDVSLLEVKLKQKIPKYSNPSKQERLKKVDKQI
tara:strand:+ start:317 stop:445 length:129 start_codon:yes stop_codon:yes gene_type:complete